MPGKAAHNPRRTTQQRLRPSKPDGMKSYQANDYFCRQTYELLTIQVSKWEIQQFVLLTPALCNRTCRAKPAQLRK